MYLLKHSYIPAVKLTLFKVICRVFIFWYKSESFLQIFLKLVEHRHPTVADVVTRYIHGCAKVQQAQTDK